MSFLFNLRENKVYRLSLTYSTFLVSLVAVILLLIRVLIHPMILNRLLATSFYFTTQSNVLVFIVMCFYLQKKRTQNWFKILSFIALIDIIITGIVFHIFLVSFVPNLNLMQHILHTVTPIFYFAFYFLVLNFFIPIHKFYYALLHPFMFLIMVYGIVQPFFGDMLESIFPDFIDARYVYPFLNPSNYSNGFLGLSFFVFGLLTPVILLLSLFILWLKKHYELAYKKNIEFET